LEEDDEQLAREEQFEREFNFRFEEPDAGIVSGYCVYLFKVDLKRDFRVVVCPTSMESRWM
jgi:hypothetical protein